jgi:SAM-dependent methyltransferase
MNSMAPPTTTVRRHPSAGNLDSRPVLVAEDSSPEPLPPLSFPHGTELTGDLVQLGPDLDHEQLAKLIGSVDGRRVLDLGCGTGAAAIALARRGARVIAVESSTARLAQARAAAERAEVRIEFHHSDLADLAFMRADAVDLVVSVYALAAVQDLSRVVRQVHRVLTPESPFLLSLPHPFATMLEDDDTEQQPPTLTRTSWSSTPLAWRAGADEGVAHPHSLGELFTTLTRASFRVDTVLEPRANAAGTSLHRSSLSEWVPETLVIRARKLGI